MEQPLQLWVYEARAIGESSVFSLFSEEEEIPQEEDLVLRAVEYDPDPDTYREYSGSMRAVSKLGAVDSEVRMREIHFMRIGHRWVLHGADIRAITPCLLTSDLKARHSCTRKIVLGACRTTAPAKSLRPAGRSASAHSSAPEFCRYQWRMPGANGCAPPRLPLPSGHGSSPSEQLQQVVDRASERPFLLGGVQPPHQELPEALYLFDLADHRLDR